MRHLAHAEDLPGQFPRLGQARPDLAPDLRHWVVGAYIMLYRIDPDAVTIVRIVHDARDLREVVDEF